VTKSFTALGLLRLVDQGLLDLDAPVLDYIPELALTQSAEWLPLLTVRHLLTHSSGLPYVGADNRWPDHSDAVLDSYFMSPEFADTYNFMFPPGRLFYYSNHGFDLVGLVIERVSGRPYADYMREQVFQPLGMTDATLRPEEVEAAGDYAWGPWWDEGWAEFPTESAPWQRPCGLAYASLRDLVPFAKFLMDGDGSVLSPELHAEMTSPQMNTHVYGARLQYGLGTWISDGVEAPEGIRDYDLRFVEAAGMMAGVNTWIRTTPSRRFALITSGTRYDQTFDESWAAALSLLLGLPEAPLAQLPEDPADFGRYVGTYQADSGDASNPGLVDVRVESYGLLLARQSDGTGCLLVPVCACNFGCGNDDVSPVNGVTFIDDALGNVEYLRAPELGFVAKRQ
jgi:CubicO group peptidase (beta-lactamase class C family)